MLNNNIRDEYTFLASLCMHLSIECTSDCVRKRYKLTAETVQGFTGSRRIFIRLRCDLHIVKRVTQAFQRSAGAIPTRFVKGDIQSLNYVGVRKILANMLW